MLSVARAGLTRPYVRLCLYPAMLETVGGYFKPTLVAGEWFEVVGSKASSSHRFGIIAFVGNIHPEEKQMHKDKWLKGINVIGVAPVLHDFPGLPRAEVIVLPRVSVRSVVPTLDALVEFFQVRDDVISEAAKSSPLMIALPSAKSAHHIKDGAKNRDTWRSEASTNDVLRAWVRSPVLSDAVRARCCVCARVRTAVFFSKTRARARGSRAHTRTHRRRTSRSPAAASRCSCTARCARAPPARL